MTDWTDLTDSELSIDQPVTQEKMLALRDNPRAIAEGASGAPAIQAAALAETTSERDWVLGRIGDGNLGAEYLQTGSQEESWVRNRTAGSEYGEVGTYAWLENTGSKSVSSNSNTTLVPASGAWKCMTSGGVAAGEKGLFLRIS